MPPVPKVRLMLSTPQTRNAPTRNRSHFGSFLAPESPQNSGQKSPSPVASTGGRSGQSGTLQGATGGTQTHSRRTGRKLGRLHRARQGLVRVPESNTKYGGKGEKTGGRAAPVWRQVSVSPQGFPRKKNHSARANLSFAPLFTGQLFIVAEGLLREDSREVTGCPGWHARRPMATGPDNRHGAADSIGQLTLKFIS
jgi:hypothetical protein